MPKTKTFEQMVESGEIVTLRSIAERLDVERQTVYAWRSKRPDFPTPHVVIEDRPYWRWSDIEAWRGER